MDNRDIQGSVNVSRHVKAGGNGEVGGTLSVGHNLRVKGWVDAPHIKGPLKGLYGSEAQLKESYPEPEPGWFALVGDTLPAAIYRADYNEATGRTEWRSTGEKGGTLTLYHEGLEEIMRMLEEMRAAYESGNMTEEDLAKLRQACKEEVMAELEPRLMGEMSLTEMTDMTGEDAKKYIFTAYKKPHRYVVTDGMRVVGMLEIISDNLGHVVTQLFMTHCVLTDGTFNGSHSDVHVYRYYRSYNVNSSLMPKEAWSEWKIMSTSDSEDAGVLSVRNIYRGEWEEGATYYDGSVVVEEPSGNTCLERSEVQRYGCLWLCNKTGTEKGPMFGENDAWSFESGIDVMTLQFDTTQDSVNISEPKIDLGVICRIGNHDFTDEGVIRYDWSRRSWHGDVEDKISDDIWNEAHSNIGPRISLDRDDFNYTFGVAPEKLILTVTATLIDGEGKEVRMANGELLRACVSFDLTTD